MVEPVVVLKVRWQVDNFFGEGNVLVLWGDLVKVGFA
jgi:hypothetical protein